MSNNRTKLFKIGEYAEGGHIRINVNKGTWDKLNYIEMIVIDMFTKEELARRKFVPDSFHAIDEYTFELVAIEYTTSYYAGKMWKWIKSVI